MKHWYFILIIGNRNEQPVQIDLGCFDQAPEKFWKDYVLGTREYHIKIFGKTILKYTKGIKATAKNKRKFLIKDE